MGDADIGWILTDSKIGHIKHEYPDVEVVRPPASKFEAVYLFLLRDLELHQTALYEITAAWSHIKSSLLWMVSIMQFESF